MLSDAAWRAQIATAERPAREPRPVREPARSPHATRTAFTPDWRGPGRAVGRSIAHRARRNPRRAGSRSRKEESMRALTLMAGLLIAVALLIGAKTGGTAGAK